MKIERKKLTAKEKQIKSLMRTRLNFLRGFKGESLEVLREATKSMEDISIGERDDVIEYEVEDTKGNLVSCNRLWNVYFNYSIVIGQVCGTEEDKTFFDGSFPMNSMGLHYEFDDKIQEMEI